MLKFLLRRKLRNSFAVVGVALGVAAMISLSAITEGTIHQYERLAAEFRGDIMIQRAGMLDPAFSQVKPDVATKFKAWPEVSNTYLVAFYAIKMLHNPTKQNANSRFFVITGVEPESKLLLRHRLIAGDYFSNAGAEIILGQQAAADMGLQIGNFLEVDKQRFKIVGIYHTGVRLMDKGALISIADIAILRQTANVNLIVLDLVAGTDRNELVSKVNTQMPELEAMISSEVLDNFDQVRLFRNVGFGISILAILMAVLGILNTMIMSVHERTRELGILRALGWTRSMILLLVFREGLILSVIGGAIGFLGGIAATEILVHVIDIGLIEAQYSGRMWGLATIIVFIVGAVGSALPALQATRITPLQALRYE